MNDSENVSQDSINQNKAESESTPEAKHQLTNHLLYIKKNILPLLIKQQISWPFRKPVDYKALNLLDYPVIITHPMDLSTISERLDHGWYESATQLIEDFDLMINNCLTYSRPMEDVSHMAHTLKKFFYEKLKKMPAEETLASEGKKRDSHKLKTSDSGTEKTVGVKRSRFILALQKRCFTIICDIFDPKNVAFAEPFYRPVDTSRFVDYLDLISSPMDLSIVKRNVDLFKYESFMDFAYDVKLIFNNCYIYNVAGSEIYQQAQLLEKLFNQLVIEASNHYCEEERVESLIRSLEDKIKSLEDEVIELQTGDPKDSSRRQSTNNSKTNSLASDSMESDQEHEYSYEDKRKISGLVTTKLPSEELMNIVKMCSEESFFKDVQTSEELVIDFDSLKNSTIRKIEKYVDGYLRRSESNKRKISQVAERHEFIGSENPPKKSHGGKSVMNMRGHLSDDSSSTPFSDSESDNMMGLG